MKQINKAIQELDNKIEQLSAQIKEHNKIGRKIAKKYSVEVPITSGPDRGYCKTVWNDQDQKKLYEHNVEQWRPLSRQRDSLMQARSALRQALRQIELAELHGFMTDSSQIGKLTG